MRGRTNIGDGGGLEINGSKVEYVVKSGTSISEGDFVQLEDTVVTEDITFPFSSITGFETFNLSNGNQITFYIDNNSSYNQVLHAIIEEYSQGSLVSSVDKTINLPNNYHPEDRLKHYIVSVGNDKFVFFSFTATQYSYTVSGQTKYAYKLKPIAFVIDYDVLNDEFSVVRNNTDFPYLLQHPISEGSTNLWAYLFSVKDAGNNCVVIAQSLLYDYPSPSTTGNLSFILYDYVQDSIVADTGSITCRFDITDTKVTARMENHTELIGDYFIFCFQWNEYNYYSFGVKVDSVNGTLTIISPALPFGYDTPIKLTNTKFLLCSRNSTYGYIYEIVSDEFQSIKQVVLPFVVQRSLIINNKLFVGRTETADGIGSVSNVVFDPVEDEISFSDISPDSCYIYTTRTIQLPASSMFSTRTYNYSSGRYGLLTITKEVNGMILPTTETGRKVKPYSNRIDGVANISGAGGDTIEVFVPASS